MRGCKEKLKTLQLVVKPYHFRETHIKTQSMYDFTNLKRKFYLEAGNAMQPVMRPQCTHR